LDFGEKRKNVFGPIFAQIAVLSFFQKEKAVQKNKTLKFENPNTPVYWAQIQVLEGSIRVQQDEEDSWHMKKQF